MPVPDSAAAPAGRAWTLPDEPLPVRLMGTIHADTEPGDPGAIDSAVVRILSVRPLARSVMSRPPPQSSEAMPA